MLRTIITIIFIILHITVSLSQQKSLNRIELKVVDPNEEFSLFEFGELGFLVVSKKEILPVTLSPTGNIQTVEVHPLLNKNPIQWKITKFDTALNSIKTERDS